MRTYRPPDAHFADPTLAALYDTTCPWSVDSDFYLSLAGPKPQAILDLGCGTGLLATAYARLGHDVVGVDPARAMLDVASTKENADRVDWVEAFAQNFNAGRSFDLVVMTGHSFQTLIGDDDVAAVLARARALLRNGGTLAFETRNPEVDWVARWDGMRSRFDRPEGPFDQLTTSVHRRGELIRFEHVFELHEKALTTSSELRFMSRLGVESALDQAGFRSWRVFGDWNRSPFDAARSPEMIFVVAQAPR